MIGTPITIAPSGPFDLAMADRFLGGWTPGTYTRPGASGHVHLAFVLDGSRTSVGVCVRQPGGADQPVIAEVADTQPGGDAIDAVALQAQVARIFSLDIDGTGYGEVGRRDPVIGALQARFPGLRPVCFYSPFEAGVWALISTRLRMDQAAGIKARIAASLGRALEVHGQELFAFPDSWTLAEMERLDALPTRKAANVRAFASAAIAGQLDAGRLRALPREQVLAELEKLPGIGPWSAAHILLRGAGEPDHPALEEKGVVAAIRSWYGPGADLEAVTDRWHPYRTWVAVLLRVAGSPSISSAPILSSTFAGVTLTP